MVGGDGDPSRDFPARRMSVKRSVSAASSAIMVEAALLDRSGSEALAGMAI